LILEKFNSPEKGRQAYPSSSLKSIKEPEASALSLLVARLSADDSHYAITLDYFAFSANALY